MKKLTYKKAGVDIKKGDKFVDIIKPLAKSTFDKGVLSGLGSFAGFYEPDITKYTKPVLVGATDGVGTKLEIACKCKTYNTVGIDLVAMCVNDLIVQGAKPLFFLDYLATGRLNVKSAASVVEGIVKGCREADCALLGGETAEMPGFYKPGEYELAGFTVGIVDKNKIITGAKIASDDIIIGLQSSGLHSNGFSLVRKVFNVDKIGSALKKELLTPTRIYVKVIMKLLGKCEIKGMAHITGGGIEGNLARILPKNCQAHINTKSWKTPHIFEQIQKKGNIESKEMFKVFNMGIGMILVVSKKESDKAMSFLSKIGEKAYLLGEISKGKRGVKLVSISHDLL
ncbi:MAG: phosphoribosylformylglycinamidine cyclo-ligase [bacterium]|nr:phosphoribosylformylglycinamidine cyclo-ligase [bacterium]